MTTQIQTIPATETEQTEFQTEQVLTIAGGHFVHDMFSAFLAPLLPLIIERLSISLTLAGTLWGMMQLPAVLNPFIGYLADRLSLRYFVIFAPAVTATLMSLLGLAPSYAALALILLAAGVSVAAFHAPAAPMVARISGNQLGRGMSFFMASGELGRTIGPLLAVWAVSTWTLEGYYRLMVIGWGASLILFWRLRNIPARSDRRLDLRAMLPAARRLFVPLFGVIVSRQFMLTTLTVYLPTFMTREGASLWVAGASLSIWELAGIGGALLSGTLSDYFGRKTVLFVVMSSASLLMLVFLNVSGWVLVPVLLVLGFTALASTPIMLAMVQEHFPQHRALANGLFMTLSFLVRPVAAFLIGLWGDYFGLHSAFFWAALISLLAVPVIFLLPQTYLQDDA